MSPRIALTRVLPDSSTEALRTVGEVVAPTAGRPLTSEELRSHVAGADVVVSQLYDHIDIAVFDAAGPQLRLVANVAAGFNNIDVAAATARGVLVSNTPGVLTDATADLAMGMTVMVMRRLGEGERLIRRGEEWAWDLDFMLGSSLRDRTLGIVGYGQIGRAVADRARAFGMRILRASARPGVASEAGATTDDGVPRVSLEHLLADSDVVSLHCPLTPETTHLMNAERLAAMRPGSFLVNTARGPVVDEAALVEALEQGHLGGAALDVFEEEPAVHPGLLALENVVLVPHLGSATHEVRTAMADLAAANVVACLNGRPLPTQVGANGQR